MVYSRQAQSPMIALHGIAKAFRGVFANDHIDLDIYGAEIHALLGKTVPAKAR